jgi:heme exporter protein A
MNILLVAEALQLWRGDLHVLRGLSFALGAGQCLQVTGANGAGKTSLLRALCGLLPLEGGRVMWRDADVRVDPPHLHRELAYLGHGSGLKADLSGLENLRYAAGMRRRHERVALTSVLRAVGLPPATDNRLVREMSAGQQRRIGLARVLLAACALWVMDEPTSNLDAAGQELFTELLRAHLAQGGVAVVATHQSLQLAPDSIRLLELK